MNALIDQPTWELIVRGTNNFLAMMQSKVLDATRRHYRLTDEDEIKRVFFARMDMIGRGVRTIDDGFEVGEFIIENLLGREAVPLGIRQNPGFTPSMDTWYAAFSSLLTFWARMPARSLLEMCSWLMNPSMNSMDPARPAQSSATYLESLTPTASWCTALLA